MVLVKICGIKSIEDALAATAAGVDELGFHVALDHGRSPLSPEEAKAIITQLPSGVSAVVVTSLTDPLALAELARKTHAHVLQLYGDSSPASILKVKAIAPEIQVWKVFHVSRERDIERAKEFEGIADVLVLDTLNAATGARGGSGETHDWNLSRKVVEAVLMPVVLAGGLNPENVVSAVRLVHPAGVDVNSGVSNRDGTKDTEKVRRFVRSTKGLQDE